MQTRQLLIRYEDAVMYFAEQMIKRSAWFSLEPGPEDWWFLRYNPEQQSFINKIVEEDEKFTTMRGEEVERIIGCGCTK